MKTRLASRLTVLAVVTLTTLALLASASTPVLADGTIVPVNGHPYGATYGEWTARWWQWMYQLPVHDATGDLSHPLFVDGPTDCFLGQTGHVWFLGGKLGLLTDPLNATANRSCSIPSGTALFFPLLNAEFDYEASGLTPGVDPMPVDPLRQAVDSYMDATTELHATIDGTPVPNLFTYRAQSPVFAYSLPAIDNVYQALGADVPGRDWPTTTVYPAVSDGYWLFVHPLPPGKHTITFGGTRDGGVVDVTYHITVTPGH